MGACCATEKKAASESDMPPAKAPQKEKDSQPASTNPAKPDPTPQAEEPPDTDEEDQSGDEDEDLISLNEGIQDFYQFGKELGSGAYSVVLEARNKKTGEMVAVKCIDLNTLEVEATPGVDPLLPLKREIKIMKKVTHANVIRLFEVFVDEEKFYMVMELMPGEELFQRIERQGNYSEKQASRIFRQIVSAVKYLHEMGVAHRDLKPENLLVCGEGENEIVKLTDFGFAKYFLEDQLKTALGSPGYAAPELFTADQYDESVDMWSLGVICYVLLSGTPPFYGDTIKELTDKIVAAQFDFDDPCWDSVSDAAKDLICHLLVKDPKKRYTAQQTWENLWVQGIQAGDNILSIMTGKGSAMPEKKPDDVKKASAAEFTITKEITSRGGLTFSLGKNKDDASEEAFIQGYVGGLPEDFEKLLAKDLAVMKSVNNFFIAQFYEAFVDSGKYYIVYEWMPKAEDLSTRLKKGALNHKEAAIFARQMISALDYLHTYGFVHRDIRTELFQVGVEDGTEMAKLSTLGVCKGVSRGPTTPYHPPEGDAAEQAGDVWALGVVIYEMLAGTTDGASEASFEGGAWPNVPEDAKELLRGMLTKDPKDRWNSKRCKESAWVKI